jgi:hypothetical protein
MPKLIDSKIGFHESRQLLQKIIKIAEDCDHNIGSWFDGPLHTCENELKLLGGF